MPFLATRLHCSRAGIPVLRDVDIALADGEIVALRGANGSGKSTLLRCIAGLVPSLKGGLSIDGIDQNAEPDLYAEKIAYAGHLDAIKPQLTVAENLAFWSALFGGGNVADALAALGLGAIADRPAHACSAGQKRRLGLARLMVVARRLWLLDEPTVALDEAALQLLRDAVSSHCAAGGMAIIATHTGLGLPTAQTLTLKARTSRNVARVEHDPFLAGSMS